MGPSLDFDEQEQDYQDSVLLSNYSDILRIYVEKAATKNTGHDKYAQFSVLMPSYGLSGPSADVERKLEFTPEYVQNDPTWCPALVRQGAQPCQQHE